MATAAREMVDLKTVPAQDGVLTPVIVDGGDTVWVALVRFPSAPKVGNRFLSGGRTYEIVRAKDYARGFVARPVADPAC